MASVCSNGKRRVKTAPPDIHELRKLSAKLGRDPSLVQAASGKPSIKVSGELWIKASANWLPMRLG